MHAIQDIITIFNNCFLADYNTCLVKGGEEPVYLPATAKQPHHELHFAHGFYASALHECSHWLIAGDARRLLVDFGYWYAPDGRTAEQQQLFQRVEVKPQAMEWILATAAGFRFTVSIDNLNGAESETESFKFDVYQQVKQFIDQGLNDRAARLRHALCKFYGTPLALHFDQFDLSSL